jgi:predicted  nucleic acid-binding Zn-ribbon protein
MEYKCNECGHEYKNFESDETIENICPNCRSNNVEPFKKTIPIKLTPVKTLDEWFANLPLIYKLDLYNSYSEVITKHLK